MCEWFQGLCILLVRCILKVIPKCLNGNLIWLLMRTLNSHTHTLNPNPLIHTCLTLYFAHTTNDLLFIQNLQRTYTCSTVLGEDNLNLQRSIYIYIYIIQPNTTLQRYGKNGRTIINTERNIRTIIFSNKNMIHPWISLGRSFWRPSPNMHPLHWRL